MKRASWIRIYLSNYEDKVLKKVEKEEKRRKDEDLFKVVDSTIDTRTYLNIRKDMGVLRII